MINKEKVNISTIFSAFLALCHKKRGEREKGRPSTEGVHWALNSLPVAM